jgi:hypothetical protein
MEAMISVVVFSVLVALSTGIAGELSAKTVRQRFSGWGVAVAWLIGLSCMYVLLHQDDRDGFALPLALGL